MIEIVVIGGVILLLAGLVANKGRPGKSESYSVPNMPDYVLSATHASDINSSHYTLDALYEKHGRANGVDPRLLKAVAQVESSENPNAKNPADPSYGLMQLYCTPDGKGGCKNVLNVEGWPPVSVEQLYDPDYSLHIGAQILSWNISTYGLEKGVAVYNSWSARHDPPEGPFSNQGYVDKVITIYNALGYEVWS